MNILIALNHPAHYYLFKFISINLKQNGNKVIFIIKGKDILEKILITENVPYVKISEKKKVKGKSSILSKGIVELIQRDFVLYKYVRKDRPDIMIGTDIAISHVGKVLAIPSIIYNEDDFEINKIFCHLAYPMATHIIAPEHTSVGKYNHKKIPYNGIQKMCYLNTKFFKPDKTVLELVGLKEGEPFYIIRLVSLTAGHDIEGNHQGINKELLFILIKLLKKKGKVFISSEDELPLELSEYRVNIPVNRMHDLMFYASLFIGDSQSMCAEAGILGTPFIRFNDFVGEIEYLNEIENKYNLGWGIKTDNPQRLLSLTEELINNDRLKEEWIIKSQKLFDEKIDLTSFSVWFIENYPQSVDILKENPAYQFRFK